MANPSDILEEEGQREYLAALRAGISAYYMGIFTQMEFVDHMFAMVRHGLNQAFEDGLALAGITADEMTLEEQVALRSRIDAEFRLVLSLADYIRVNREEQVPLSIVFAAKVGLWGMRYVDIHNLTVTFGGGDRKFAWILGPTEHCKSCLALAGKVKRLSMWKKSGYKPQADWNGQLPNVHLV